MEIESTPKKASWFSCPGCDRMVTGLVRQGHPHPERHETYSYSHCCLCCERGEKIHATWWYCAGVPKKWLRSVTLKTGKEQHYILHDPGGRGSRPVLLFLHGASTYIYPELLHWDIHDLLQENSVVREFIILAPFGSIGEPVVKSQKKLKSDRFYNMVPYVKCFDPDILWDFFMSALKDLWNDGNSETRFDPARLHVTGCSLGGQATWALSCFYGSCLASAAPMAAKCAWEEDSWDHGAKILQELRHLPVWTYACKWDFTAFSHEDHWWIAEHRDLDIYAKQVEVLTEGSVHGICHQWSEDLTLTLLQGTPSHHNAWAPVLHNEKAFGVFTRMLSRKCENPPSMEGDERCEGRYPHTKLTSALAA